MPAKSQSRRTPLGAALSQHRLADSTVAERIVASTGLAPPDLVFELGAGDGALTEALAARCRRVVAVEIDRTAWAMLKVRFRGNPRVSLVLGDMLTQRFPCSGVYKVVANVPYAMTSPLLRRLASLEHPPAEAYLILPADAAQRWLGLAHESLVSILFKARFEAEAVAALRRRDFAPRPRVDSVLVRLRARPARARGDDFRAFGSLVRQGFGGGRRTVRANLRGRISGALLDEVSARRGFDPEARPHELTLPDWQALFAASPGGYRRAPRGH